MLATHVTISSFKTRKLALHNTVNSLTDSFSHVAGFLTGILFPVQVPLPISVFWMALPRCSSAFFSHLSDLCSRVSFSRRLTQVVISKAVLCPLTLGTALPVSRAHFLPSALLHLAYCVFHPFILSLTIFRNKNRDLCFVPGFSLNVLNGAWHLWGTQYFKNIVDFISFFLSLVQGNMHSLSHSVMSNSFVTPWTVAC